MTLEPWMIYLVALVDKMLDVVNSLTFLLSAITVLAIFSVFVCMDDHENKPYAFCKKHIKKWFVALVIVSVVQTFVPSGKVLAAMYVLPPIVNSAAVQELPAELVELARAYIKDTIGNLKEDGQ